MGISLRERKVMLVVWGFATQMEANMGGIGSRRGVINGGMYLNPCRCCSLQWDGIAECCFLGLKETVYLVE